MLNAEKLRNWPFRDVVRRYGETDSILYALSVGLGADPVDERQLRYVYEPGLKTFATMPLVLGMVDDLQFLHAPEVGIDLPRMLHGETGLRLHRPLPPAGTVVSRLSINDLSDKGEAKGAVLSFSRTIRDAESGALLATETGTFLLRGNGGFGGRAPPAVSVPRMPASPADAHTDLKTSPRAALLYRLTGDRNSLHAEPAVARKVGFTAPILHGACSYGHAAHGLARLLCDYDSHRLKFMNARFTAPVYPGETLRLELWKVGRGSALFRVTVVERQVVALDNGQCDFEES